MDLKESLLAGMVTASAGAGKARLLSSTMNTASSRALVCLPGLGQT